jgi:hypothetical protein
MAYSVAAARKVVTRRSADAPPGFPATISSLTCDSVRPHHQPDRPHDNSDPPNDEEGDAHDRRPPSTRITVTTDSGVPTSASTPVVPETATVEAAAESVGRPRRPRTGPVIAVLDNAFGPGLPNTSRVHCPMQPHPLSHGLRDQLHRTTPTWL